MFENYSEEYIRNRLLNRIRDSLAKMEGTILWEIMNSVAIESKEIFIEMENIYNQRLLDTASEDNLTDLCRSFFGINRKLATSSKGTIRFNGTNGTSIPQGIIIATENGIQFQRVKRTNPTVNPTILSLYSNLTFNLLNEDIKGKEVTVSFYARTSQNTKTTLMVYEYSPQTNTRYYLL